MVEAFSVILIDYGTAVCIDFVREQFQASVTKFGYISTLTSLLHTYMYIP